MIWKNSRIDLDIYSYIFIARRKMNTSTKSVVDVRKEGLDKFYTEIDSTTEAQKTVTFDVNSGETMEIKGKLGW